MSLRRFRVLGFAVGLTASAGVARADDLESILEQNVVTAPSQAAETTTTAPATTSVITAEDIRRHGIRSLNEALNYLGLGMFTTNPSHGVEIGVRGLILSGDYGNHVLLLIDGHAVNEAWAGAASFDRGLGVPMKLIDHVEVMLGPASVLYGSNAMLGVINVVTKRAKDWSGVHVVADSELFDWWKIGAGGGTQATIFGRRFELTTQVEYQKQDGPAYTFAPQVYGNDGVTGTPKRYAPDGPATGVWGGRTENSHYARAPSAYARIVTGNLEVSLRGSSYQRSTPYLDAVIAPTGNFDAPHDYELENWFFADLKYRHVFSRVFALKTRVYGDLYSYDWYNTSSAAEDCVEGQLDGCRRHMVGRARWAGVEVQGTFDWIANGRLSTLVGVDARTENSSGTLAYHALGTTPAPSPSVGDFDVTNVRLGVYGQQLASPTRWLTLNAGIRGDVAEGYRGALSPRAAAIVTPWQASTLKAVYSQAFRAPSTYEREYQDTYFIANRDLQPERSRSYEASFEQRFGAHRLMLGVFHTRLTHVVAMSSATPEEVAVARAAGQPISDPAFVSLFRNADALYATGYNGALEGGVGGDRLRYALNVTGASARRTTSDGDITPALAPRVFGNARVSYDLAGKLPTLALAAQYQAQRPVRAGSDAPVMPYAPPLLELRAAVSGPVPGIPNLSYRLTANYAFADRGPYAVGPLQAASSAPTLNPVDRFRAGVGLTWTIDP